MKRTPSISCDQHPAGGRLHLPLARLHNLRPCHIATSPCHHQHRRSLYVVATDLLMSIHALSLVWCVSLYVDTRLHIALNQRLPNVCNLISKLICDCGGEPRSNGNGHREALRTGDGGAWQQRKHHIWENTTFISILVEWVEPERIERQWSRSLIIDFSFHFFTRYFISF